MLHSGWLEHAHFGPLRDHFDAPTGICNHGDPDDHLSNTRPSVIMDLEQRRMLAAAGPPCQHADIEPSVVT